jgi:agmatinase
MPKTVLPDARVSPRFAGISTFARYPRLEDVAPENAPVDWAIYGVPMDAGVSYRPGARFGPRAIRDASQYVKRYHVQHNVDVCGTLSLADAGDAPVAPFSINDTLDLVESFASSLVSAPSSSPNTRLMAVGGDHSISYANIRATYSRLGEPSGGIALIHFDAHLDTVDTLWGEKYSHASPFRRVIEEGFVDPRRMISIGMRGPLNSAEDLAFVKQQGVTLISCDDLARSSNAPVMAGAVPSRSGLNCAAIDAFLNRIGTLPTYITFDIDCIDPAFAPGTGTPCPGGLSSAEAFDLLRRLAGVNVAGADVVEVLPDRDPSGITALLAGHVMFEILALDAINRR